MNHKYENSSLRKHIKFSTKTIIAQQCKVELLGTPNKAAHLTEHLNGFPIFAYIDLLLKETEIISQHFSL